MEMPEESANGAAGSRTGPVARPVALCGAVDAMVALVFDVGVADIAATTRGSPQVALARQVAMYLVHTSCGLSMAQTGVLFARDRTTVAHACELVEDKRDDDGFDLELARMEAAIAALRDADLTGPKPCFEASSRAPREGHDGASRPA